MSKEDILLIVGSLNANIADRNIKREEVKTVQSYTNGEFSEIPFFTSQGELGVSSICFQDIESTIWYYTTGADFKRLDLETGQVDDIFIPQLKGVHEITWINNSIWLSNTFFDEIIEFSIVEQKVVKRIKLQQAANPLKEVEENEVDPSNLKRQNKFHCNQIFADYDGKLKALVHHVNGEQIINRVAQKLLKSQGNGGVLDIENGSTKRLKLKAPHSVRMVNHQYWIFDSGHAQLNVYDKDWKLIKEVAMAGWGRGGDYSANSKIYYAGVSAKRNRYLAFNEENRGENMVQCFNRNYNIEKDFVVPNIEQVNNIYIVSSLQLELLKKI